MTILCLSILIIALALMHRRLDTHRCSGPHFNPPPTGPKPDFIPRPQRPLPTDKVDEENEDE